MVSFGPVFFSAIGICESCTNSFSGGSCDEERKNNWENVDTLQDHVLDPSDRGTCGSEQFKHGDHYSGNRCDLDLCSKPEICAVCLDGTRRRVLYGAFSCP